MITWYDVKVVSDFRNVKALSVGIGKFKFMQTVQALLSIILVSTQYLQPRNKSGNLHFLKTIMSTTGIISLQYPNFYGYIWK